MPRLRLHEDKLGTVRRAWVKDIFIACVDGLKGFPEAIEAIYPHTEVQLCIVHMVRASLNYVSWKHRKKVAAELQLILSCRHRGGGRRATASLGAQLGSLSVRSGGGTGIG